MKRLVLIGLCSVVSGCGLLGDHLVVAGTPEGIRAFADGQSGLVAQARTHSKTGQTAYWETRRAQEHEFTERSIWSRIWRGGLANTGGSDERY